jgi:hypothetical protein
MAAESTPNQPLGQRSGRHCTFSKNWNQLSDGRLFEPILCRRWNELLAAVHNNRAISDLNFLLVFEFWNLPLPKVQIGS